MKIDLEKMINPILYVLFIICVYAFLSGVLRFVFARAKKARKMDQRQKQRIDTIHGILKSILRYLTLILIFLAILVSIGVNVNSVVAGLGLLTAILGLAFQDLIKDVIAGVTIITEGQFDVGDMVEVSGFKGRVLSVGVKTTQIENYRGEVKIISNRNVDDLVNYSKFKNIAEVTVKIDYRDDLNTVNEALEEVKKRTNKEFGELITDTSVVLVSDLDEQGIVCKISCSCDVGDSDNVKGYIKREIVEEFDKREIEFAKQNVEVSRVKK